MANADKMFVDTTEPLLSVDKYYRPLIAENENYATLMLIRLILLEPGTFQTHPDMGVGLVSRFRYSSEVDMSKLSNIIKNQVMKYLPQFTFTDVKCELSNNELNDKKYQIYIRSKELNVYLPINVETGEVIEKPINLIDFK